MSKEAQLFLIDGIRLSQVNWSSLTRNYGIFHHNVYSGLVKKSDKG